MSVAPWVVTALCVAANGGVLYAVMGAVQARDAASLERATRLALAMLGLVLVTSLAGFALGARAMTSALFAVFFGLYPAAAALWLHRRARQAGAPR